MNKRIFFIAEAGVNHNGNPDLALRLIYAAASAGADAVKFQTFRTDRLAVRNLATAPYQRKSSGESQYAMLARLELTNETFQTLADHCEKCGIEFLSTPFDPQSAHFLAELGMTTFKVPSGGITNLPLLRTVAELAKRIILSTGMANLAEVQEAVASLETAGLNRNQLTLLHCTSAYPTPFEEVNLRAMGTLAESFPECETGYSDHTQGMEIAIAATALGAQVIEKHFTLDRTMNGPDHAASIEPEELASLIRAVRHVETALGDGVKQPVKSELVNRNLVRGYIVAARRIDANQIIEPNDLTVKRTGGLGAHPMRFDELIGTKALKSYETDEPVEA